MNKKVEDKKQDSSSAKDKIISLKKKLFGLRLKNKSGDLTNPSEIKKTRKEIARLFTKMNSKG